MKTFSCLKIICLLFTADLLYAAPVEPDTVSEKFQSRLLPAPQSVSFSGKTFVLGKSWSLALSPEISKNSMAVKSLIEGLATRGDIMMNGSAAGKLSAGKKQIIRLTIKKGSVKIGKSIDKDTASLKEQAYRLQLKAGEISIVANAPAGLFYGVQTLLQLLKPEPGNAMLPEGQITDWPEMNLRAIYWDDSHHLDHFDELKRAIGQAAYYKINAFILKLEAHFEFVGAAPIVEPYALTKAEHQELTDYALARHIELIPYLDAPAHVTFILKHPEYNALRSFPHSNYSFNLVDPKVDELILGMFNELIDANKGGKYVFFSTDEAYYAGKADMEKKKTAELGGNGKLLANFISRIAEPLHKKGRKVIIWGEYPLVKEDVTALPSYLINGINENNEDFGSSFRDHGIRNFVFTSTQGMEPLFPEYHRVNKKYFTESAAKAVLSDDEMQQGRNAGGRVADISSAVESAIKANKTDLMGIIVCGWADAGLHTETFWLGYAAGAATAWKHGLTPDELSTRFYHAFYGKDAYEIDKVYRLLSRQAQFWTNSWNWAPLGLRTPIVGNSNGLHNPPRAAEDQTLPPLPVPENKTLALTSDWSSANRQRVERAREFLAENEELEGLLHRNLRNVQDQQHHLRVFLSVSELCKQNLQLLLGLDRIDSLLKLSSKTAINNPSVALFLLDQALDQASAIHRRRNETLQSLTTTWYESWLPRVVEANGRKYLDQVDDVKDHQPMRTADMSYLIYRDLHYPLGEWAAKTSEVRNAFAAQNNLPKRSITLNWTDYGQ